MERPENRTESGRAAISVLFHDIMDFLLYFPRLRRANLKVKIKKKVPESHLIFPGAVCV